MAEKKGGLGKGLDSLITNKVNTAQLNKGLIKEEAPSDKKEQMVKITKVEPNREQPRKKFDEDALIELSESIKQYGIIQPIIVKDRKDYYEIIAGERRWRAAKMAGLKEVPVIVRDYTEQEIVEISLIENIQRENLNPIEEAQAYKKLIEEFNMKQDEIAEKVSKSRTAVTNSMRLLKLCEKVQQMVIDEMITTGHARCLISLENAEVQYKLAQKIFDEKLSVRETEKLVKKVQKDAEKTTDKDTEKENREEMQQLNLIYQSIMDEMKEILGTKVEIHQTNSKKGKIEIEYYSKDELNRILEMMQTMKKS